MNYELAKELKDAGFPQNELIGRTLCNYRGNADHGHSKECQIPEITIPNLSELIAACGENFSKLEKMGLNFGTYGYPDSSSEDGSGLMIETGLTPEISVAHFWLALNKKQ